MSLENKVAKILVKRGHNIEFAVSLVKKNLEAASKIRPEATPGKLADIVVTL